MKYRYDIVVAGWIGLNESIIKLSDPDLEKECLGRYPKHFIDKVKSRKACLYSEDVIKRALTDIKPLYMDEQSRSFLESEESLSNIIYCIDKGGLYRALWDMSLALNKGFEIERYSIPVLQETVEICDFFDENLYEVDGKGSYLIYTEDATSVNNMLKGAGIPSQIIGFATKELAKQIIRDEDIQYLDKPRKSMEGQR